MCILRGMLQTHLAMHRRLSRCPKQTDVAAAMSCPQSRISAVEAGRAEASREWIERLAKVLGLSADLLWLAHLLDRKAFYSSASRVVQKQIAEARASHGTRRKSA